MRAFTVPIDLEQFELRGWRTSEGKLLFVDRAIDTAERAWKLPRRSAKQLSDVSEPLRTAGLLGSNPDGLWRPSEWRLTLQRHDRHTGVGWIDVVPSDRSDAFQLRVHRCFDLSAAAAVDDPHFGIPGDECRIQKRCDGLESLVHGVAM